VSSFAGGLSREGRIVSKQEIQRTSGLAQKFVSQKFVSMTASLDLPDRSVLSRACIPTRFAGNYPLLGYILISAGKGVLLGSQIGAAR
jgi:hypothetical protein